MPLDRPITSGELHRFIEINSLIKKLQDEAKVIKPRIVEHMVSNNLTHHVDEDAGVQISYTSAERTTLDSKAIKAEKPDVFTTFSRISEVKTLKVTKA